MTEYGAVVMCDPAVGADALRWALRRQCERDGVVPPADFNVVDGGEARDVFEWQDLPVPDPCPHYFGVRFEV